MIASDGTSRTPQMVCALDFFMSLVSSSARKHAIKEFFRTLPSRNRRRSTKTLGRENLRSKRNLLASDVIYSLRSKHFIIVFEIYRAFFFSFSFRSIFRFFIDWILLENRIALKKFIFLSIVVSFRNLLDSVQSFFFQTLYRSNPSWRYFSPVSFFKAFSHWEYLDFCIFPFTFVPFSQ